MHVGTDFLKLPPVTGQYWSLFQCSMLGTGGTCDAVQYVNSATSTHTTGEACKAAVEAYAASLLPPTAMCELVVNMRAPKYSWRTLSELYTLRKLEYHRTVPSGPSRPICTERDFQACWKELVAPMQLDEPVATVLPKATRISWPFASWVTYMLSRPGLVRSINRNLPLSFIVQGDAYAVAGGNWTQLTISLAKFDQLASSPAGLWSLSMANCDECWGRGGGYGWTRGAWAT